MEKKMGRKVLLTGVSGSIGFELAKAFHAKGYSISALYRSDSQELKELAGLINLKLYLADFRSEFSIPDDEIDILINNAAVNISNKECHELEREVWDETIRVNLTAPFMICQQLIPNMMRKNWGRIININSIFGLRAVEGNLPYTVSKHGLSGLTKTLAKEYGPHGITCNEICPGPVNSKLLTRVARRETDGSLEKEKEYYSFLREYIPTKRLGEPSDITALALFLASEESRQINGVSIPVDGGEIC